MSKRAILFHGTGGSPDVCWLPWLKEQLIMAGYEVEVPYYPQINQEPVRTFLPKVLKAHTFDVDTVLVGHSGGAPLILSILENIDVIVPQAFLVAGYSQRPNSNDEPMLQERYDWEKIKAHVSDIYFINSVNDPYGCDDEQGRIMFDELGGTLIIRNDGHFGSAEQPYDTFPLLKQLIG